MADKKKPKKKNQDIPIEVDVKPSKVEYSIATYLKKHVTTKKTKFVNHQVNYFYSNKAVDILLDSPWATGKDVLFTDRQSVVQFCDKLLRHKFFHRARKIPITDKDLKPKELKKKKEREKEEKRKKELEDKKNEEKRNEEKKNEEKRNEEKRLNGEGKDEGESSKDDKEKEDIDKTDEKDDTEKEKKKKKGKIKLDMHLDQVFVDGSDAYVWMYDPIPFWYYIAGAFCLFGAIAVCLFPLWPPGVRKGVYYLSIAAAGFLGVILGLVVLRFIVFVIIWSLSVGRHHFWFLPNLTEDVGFFASFWPLYHYEYRGSDYKKKKSKKKKKEEEEEEEKELLQEDQEDKDNDNDIDQDTDIKKSDNDDAIDSLSAGETDKQQTEEERTAGEQTAQSEETDSENSNSQTFEIVNKEELSESTKQ